MSTAPCDAARERIPELALGHLDGAERAEVLLHVHGCARCQAIVDDSSGVADLLAQLAPEAEPPAGFEQRVLREMHGGRPRDWRSIRRRVLVVGGAAAAAAILSIVVVRVIDAGRSTEQASTPTTVAPALQTVPMVGAGGLPVGRVVVSDGTPASLVVTVDYALPDGDYGLELHTTDGRDHPRDRHPGGRGRSWHVDRDRGDPGHEAASSAWWTAQGTPSVTRGSS